MQWYGTEEKSPALHFHFPSVFFFFFCFNPSGTTGCKLKIPRRKKQDNKMGNLETRNKRNANDAKMEMDGNWKPEGNVSRGAGAKWKIISAINDHVISASNLSFSVRSTSCHPFLPQCVQWHVKCNPHPPFSAHFPRGIRSKSPRTIAFINSSLWLRLITLSRSGCHWFSFFPLFRLFHLPTECQRKSERDCEQEWGRGAGEKWRADPNDTLMNARWPRFIFQKGFPSEMQLCHGISSSAFEVSGKSTQISGEKRANGRRLIKNGLWLGQNVELTLVRAKKRQRFKPTISGENCNSFSILRNWEAGWSIALATKSKGNIWNS